MRRTVALVGIVVVAALCQHSSADPAANNIPKFTGTSAITNATSSSLWEVNGNVGLGTSVLPSSSFPITAYGTGAELTLGGTGNGGPTVELASTVADGVNKTAGVVDFLLTSNTDTGPRIAEIFATSEGSTAHARGGGLEFITRADGGYLAERMRIDSAGHVGIGTNAPATALDVNGTVSASGNVVGTIVYATSVYASADINATGNMTAAGNLTVSGNLAAKYQDVAEWVDARGAAAPGTVMVLSAAERNVVHPSNQSYDTAVAGVVSPRPGLVLGESKPGRVLVAHTGRVRVHVDASYGAIGIGDLLVTSPTPGYAMRSTPVTIDGVPFHRPGTVLGKAIEPLDRGQGDILVLVTLQ